MRPQRDQGLLDTRSLDVDELVKSAQKLDVFILLKTNGRLKAESNRDYKFLRRLLQHSVYTRRMTVQPSNHDWPPATTEVLDKSVTGII
jgi:hypothetical protein